MPVQSNLEPLLTGPSPGVSAASAAPIKVEHLRKKTEENSKIMSYKKAQEDAAEKDEIEEPKQINRDEEET